MALNLSGTTGIVTGNIADANVTPGKLSQPMTLMTSQNATGGVVDFLGIPSWVNRITVVLVQVGTNGATNFGIQIGGSGGVETTNYISTSITTDSGGGSAGTSGSDAFICFSGNSGYRSSGLVTIVRSGGFTWIYAYNGKLNTTNIVSGAGAIALPSALTTVRLTTRGADTFSTGAVSVLYEG